MRYFSKVLLFGALTVIPVIAMAQQGAGPRPSRPTPNVLFLDQVSNEFLIPVVGNTPGLNGTYFRSDVMISNFRSAPQRIAVYVIERGRSGFSNPFFFDLPAFESGGDLGIISTDFLGSQLNRSGLASLVVQAVTSSGTLDPAGKIDGTSRVWTPVPGSNVNDESAGTASQSLLSVPTNHLNNSNFSAFVMGMKQDDNFRINVGIVNLSPINHLWRIDIFGTRSQATMNLSVAANSMDQVAIPAGNYGNAVVTFTLIDPNPPANTRWTAYASSVDNRTGDAWTRNANY